MRLHACLPRARRFSVAAIGNGCVIPGERERGPGSKLICGCVDATTLGPGRSLS